MRLMSYTENYRVHRTYAYSENLNKARYFDQEIKGDFMQKLILFIVLTFSTVNVFAKKDCTDEPKEKWMKVDEFKKLVQKKGFTIKKFKQPGSCYEIYGKDKDDKEVEVYFNPVNAKISKIEFESEED